MTEKGLLQLMPLCSILPRMPDQGRKWLPLPASDLDAFLRLQRCLGLSLGPLLRLQPL